MVPVNVQGDLNKQTIGQNKSITWDYIFEFDDIEGFNIKLTVDDGEDVDISEIVSQVEKGNLESWVEFIGKPRSIKFAPKHLETVRDSIFEYFEAQELWSTYQPFKILINDAFNVIGEKNRSSRCQ